MIVCIFLMSELIESSIKCVQRCAIHYTNLNRVPIINYCLAEHILSYT